MAHFPDNFRLTFLHGSELIQVCLGLHQIQFHFHPAASISVEGLWELCDKSGVQIDGWNEGTDRPSFQLHRLLGHRVSGSAVSESGRFELHFDSGDVLRVFLNSNGFESFQIEPIGVIG